MFGSHHRHFIIQRNRQIQELNSIPETRRATHFLNDFVLPASRLSRKISRLNLQDGKVKEKIDQCIRRHDGMYEVLDNLRRTEGNPTRAKVTQQRVVKSNASFSVSGEL